MDVNLLLVTVSGEEKLWSLPTSRCMILLLRNCYRKSLKCDYTVTSYINGVIGMDARFCKLQEF